MNYIRRNKQYFKKAKESYATPIDEVSAIKLAEILQWPLNEFKDAQDRLRYYEHLIVLPKLIEKGRLWLYNKTFENPIDNHGIIIAGLVLNLIALIYKYKVLP
jgi:hypothetical protein